jgi:1-acyl-sn-glycerol-3-phosphate acyltransferase
MFRYRLVRFVMTFIQVALCRLVVVGRENIPAQGPYLVVVNHMSTADTPLLLIGFPIIRWRFFAGEKWKDHWLFGPLMGWLGAIYIDREDVDRGAVREALAALKSGDVFALAPEGSRSKVGHMLPAKNGAAFLAARAGVPILPVGLSNSDVLFSSARDFHRSTVTMRIGRPFSLPALDRRVRSADLDAYTHYIMVHIAALVEPSHRGAFGESPALRALLAGEDPWPLCAATLPQAVPAAPETSST